jgi:hypothetical protein
MEKKGNFSFLSEMLHHFSQQLPFFVASGRKSAKM